MNLILNLFLPFTIIATGDMLSNREELESLFHDANNEFTANMFSEVAKIKPEQSFVISAFNVMTPLAQLGLGSVGESHDELLNAIGMPSDNTTKEVFAFVNTRIRSVKEVTLRTANKIYVATNYDLNSTFAAVTKKNFGSEVQNLDFVHSDMAANEVNNWVKGQTNNTISDLFNPSSFSANTKALLVNAIYFKGFWMAQFKTDLTRDMDFHVNKQKTNKIPMMFRRGDYSYTEYNELKSQVIEIPYMGDNASLVVVLPRDIEDIQVVEEILKNPDVLDSALKDLDETDVELYLPKFKIETTIDLKNILSKMNITRVFNTMTARLNNLLEQDSNDESNLYISTATQKAFIEVNEEGAEAAAVSGLGLFGMGPALITPSIPIEFKADHPFLFFLLVKGDVIFNGIFHS